MKKNRFIMLIPIVILFSSCGWTHNNAGKQLSFDVSKISFDRVPADEIVSPVIILGGGVAGLTAALYCAQASVSAVVIEGQKPGGALAQSHSVRNWPGVHDLPGAAIVGDIKKQVLLSGTSVLEEQILSADFSSWPYSITTEEIPTNKIIKRKALAVIVAMGTEPHYLGVPGERGDFGYWGRGVSNCAVCEGGLYKDKVVAVVGGGDAALVEASYLAGIAKQVTIFVRKDIFRAKDVKMRERLLALPHVQVKFNTRVKEIRGNTNRMTHVVLETATLRSQDNGQVRVAECEEVVPLDGLFLAIGSQPNTSIFRNHDKLHGAEKIPYTIKLDDQGFIVLHDRQQSSIPGVFAAGDICDKEFVQAVTAAGQGCMAALQAKKFLEAAGFNQIAFDKKITDCKKQHIIKDQHVQKQVMRPLQEISTREEFDRLVKKSDRPIMLDIYSTYCIPCKTLLPVVEKIAQEYEGRLACYKINASASVLLKELKRLGSGDIQSVPLLLFIERGKVRGNSLGLQSEEAIRASIKKYTSIT